jgi:hypothetical protein
VDLACTIDSNGRPLERAGAGSLGVTPEPEAESTPLLASLALAAAELVDSSEHVERAVEGPRKIAAVVDDRHAVPVRNADFVGHLVRRHHVAAPDLGGLEPDLVSDQVDESLHDEDGLGPPGTAVGRIGHLVRADDLARDEVVVDLVGSEKMGRRVVGEHGPERVPGPAVEGESITHGEDPSVAVEGYLRIVRLIPRVDGRREMLSAILDPLHRLPDPPRQVGQQDVLGVNVALDPEASPDVRGHAAHAGLVESEQIRDFAPNRVHHLGGGPDCQAVGTRVVISDDAPALHRHAGVSVVVEPSPERERRLAERGLHVALADLVLADDVRPQLWMEERRAARERGVQISHHRERLELDSDARDRVLGCVAIARDDDGDGLADVSHLFEGEDRLARTLEAVLHCFSPAVRQGDLLLGHRGQRSQEFCSGHGEDHPGNGGGRGHVDGNDPRVCQRAAHDGGVQHSRQFQVADEDAPTC